MARKAGIVLDEGHRDRIAAGELTVAALADELGVSRQSINASFKRRGWPTRPVDTAGEIDRVSPGVGVLAPESGPSGATPASSVPRHPPARSRAPTAAAAPLPGLFWGEPEDTAAIVRLELVNLALLGLAQARTALAGGKLGPAAVKAAMQAAALAGDVLERAGLVLADAAGDVAAPQMIFQELSADECAAIQGEAERAHHGLEPDDGELVDDLDVSASSAAPGPC